MKCLMDLSTKEEIFYNLAQKVAPTAINQMLTTTKYYSKAIVLAADLSLESHLKTSMTALILRARQLSISTKKFKEDKFRCGLLLLQYFFLNVWIMTSTLDDKSIFQVRTLKKAWKFTGFRLLLICVLTGSPSICGFVWNTTRWSSWRIRKNSGNH